MFTKDGDLRSMLDPEIYNSTVLTSEAELKKFEQRLKHGWFHLKLYSVFRDLSQRSFGTSFGRFSDAV